MNDPDPGKSFSELYDVDTLEPGGEWLEAYHSVSAALTNMGLDIDGAWRRVLRARESVQHR